MLVIKETSEDDLENVITLWGNGEVMYYVGYPDGFHKSMDEMKEWLKRVIMKPKRCHYSIYDDGIYCGETFYNVLENGYASMDIKLLPGCRGKGIGYKALSYAIGVAFKEGDAKAVYIDPNIENKAAWALYKKLGFQQTNKPVGVEADDTYQQITKENWNK